MSKVKGQNIPSDLYQDYLYSTRPAYTIGFNYYDSFYGYIPIHVVSKCVPENEKLKDKGLGNLFYSTRALYRYITILLSYFWNNLYSVTGTTPPFTGLRSRKWWADNKPVDIKSAYNFYFKTSFAILKYKTFCPYQIDPYFYIADNGNKIITKYNVNSLSSVSSVGNGGDVEYTFDNITSICVDKNYLFVCDNFNKQILIFNKTTLSYVNMIDSFSQSETPFGNLKDAFSDSKYLYICDSTLLYIIKQSITARSDFSNIIFFRLPGEGKPKLNNIYATYDYLFSFDKENKRLVIYIKDTKQKLTFQSFNISNCLFASTLYFYAVSNNTTKIITLFVQGTFFVYTTIGPSAAHDFNFQSIDGLCISGNLLLVLDNISKKIFQINLLDFSLLNELDITGLFLDVKCITAEPQHFYYLDT